MEWIEYIVDFFFGANFPSLKQIMLLLPLMLLYVVAVFEVTERCRVRWSWKVGYTRKSFHFAIFFMAGLIQWLVGISGVFILGWAVTLVLSYLLLNSQKSTYYYLLARPQDEPHATRYIIYPYLATFIGGVTTNVFFLPMAAITGYLVAGMGDAIGEPVGAKWGRHKYPVFNFGSPVKSYRSLEGSCSVFLACLLVFALVLYVFGYELVLWKIIIAALIAAIVEGVSPHGWDNFTIQIIGAVLIQHFIL